MMPAASIGSNQQQAVFVQRVFSDSAGTAGLFCVPPSGTLRQDWNAGGPDA
jgi:hypothetical protein